MTKLKKFTTTASAVALVSACAMVAPTAQADENQTNTSTATENTDPKDGASDDEKPGTPGENPKPGEGNGNEKPGTPGENPKPGEGNGNEKPGTPGENPKPADPDKSSLDGSSKEDLAKQFPSLSSDGKNTEGSSDTEKWVLGGGIVAALLAGLAAFLPQIQQFLPR